MIHRSHAKRLSRLVITLAFAVGISATASATARAYMHSEAGWARTSVYGPSAGAPAANVYVNREVDIHRGFGPGYDPWGAPILTEAAVTGTALGVGTTVATLPHGCSSVNLGDIAYHQCGTTYYQPVYEGTAVQYVVVVPPR